MTAEALWRALPVVDRQTGDWSLTRSLAIFFAWVDWQSIMSNPQHIVTAMHVALAVAALASAFGKSTFGFFLTRTQTALQGAQQDITATVVQEIVDRRKQGGDYEAAA